ncbi:hypothetical protein [Fructobacillus durionis]
MLVLFMLSLILTLTITFRPRKNEVTVQQFKEVFTSTYTAAKTRAQLKQKEQIIYFEQDGMQDQGKLLPYPTSYVLVEAKKIRISSSGFVSPQSINWKRGGEILKLIIQFGGGSYRFIKE